MSIDHYPRPRLPFFVLIALTLLLLSIPNLSFATDLFTPSDGDISVELVVKQLFGPIAGGDSPSPFGEMIKTFNSAVLVIGGILLMYTLIAGTMSTAHYGEMLGKKWSSLWIPIRTAIGTAAIFPGLSGGFCAAQAIVIWLAMQGIGLADKLTVMFFDAQTSSLTTQPMVASSLQAPIAKVVQDLLINSTCAHALNESVEANSSATNAAFGQTTSSAAPTIKSQTDKLIKYEYAGGDCGTAQISLASTSSNLGTGTISDAILGNQENLFIDKNALIAALATTQKTQFSNAMTSMDALGATIAAAVRSGTDPATLEASAKTQIMSVTNSWVTAVQEQINAKSSEFTNAKLKSAISSDGWFVLGSWYMQISKAQQTLFEGATQVPTVSRPDSLMTAINKSDSGGGSAWTNVQAALGFGAGGMASKMDSTAKAAIRLGYKVANAAIDSSDVPGVLPSEGSGIPTSANAIGDSFAQTFLRFIDVQPGSDTELKQDPVIYASNYGFGIMNAGFSALMVAAGIQILSTVELLGNGPGEGLALFISSTITPVGGTAVVAGSTLAYYLPMVPYILWIGALFGWIVLVVEAVIAAPLWAVTHLAPDGDGVVGRGGQGYMLVLSLTLRPALMVFGFAAAVAVMRPMGTFLNSTFFSTFFASTLSHGFAAVWAVIVGAIIYFVVMIAVVNKVFSLIHSVPDGILRWIGGGDNTIGQHASSLEGMSAGKAVAAGTAIGGISSGIQNGGDRAAQMGMRRSMEKQGRLQNEQNKHDGKRGQAADSSSRSNKDARDNLDRANSANTPDERQAYLDAAENANDRASVAAFEEAESSAHSAVVGGQLKNATGKDKAAAAQGQKFLDAVDSFRVAGGQPNFPAGAKEFMEQHSQEFAGTAMGNAMSKGVQDNNAVTASMAVARKRAFEAGAFQTGGSEKKEDPAAFDSKPNVEE